MSNGTYGRINFFYNTLPLTSDKISFVSLVNKLCSTDPIFFPIPTPTTWIGKVNFKLFPIQCYWRCRLGVQENIEAKLFQSECGKIARIERFCLSSGFAAYLMFPVCCYDGQGSVLFQRVQWISPPLHLFLKALHITQYIFKNTRVYAASGP